MVKVIEAVYENGVFKPMGKLELEEGERVRLIIDADPVELAKKYSGVGKYKKKLSPDKLYRVEVDLL